MTEKVVSILVADDEENICLLLKKILSKQEYQVFTAQDGNEALRKVEEFNPDLLIMDLKMPGKDGLEVLKAIKELNKETTSIMMTAHATIETAVEAIKQGAYDYITKPFQIDQMLLLVEKALECRRLTEEESYMRLSEGTYLAGIIGTSPKMQEVYHFIEQVAPTDAKVLILGESGTGKELVAKAIHFCSQRKGGPFVKVNCAALPETLLESELFGHEKGAFTGALNRKLGRFELAHRGTLFLDEIGEINHATQVKLLRVLQEQEFERVGGTSTIKVDVRVVAATNKELEKEVAEGRFRDDLYYRLNVVSLNLPSLRERREDIPALVQYFLEKFNKAMGKNIQRISPEAGKLLMDYHWPGNVRELENALERAVVLSSGPVILPNSLPHSIYKSTGEKVEEGQFPLKPTSLREVEKQLIMKTLDETKGNRTKAAKILGISLRTLQYKIKEYQDEVSGG